MKVERLQEIETSDIQIGDRIHVGHYTATCQSVGEQGAVFLFDQYLDEPMKMNADGTNIGGYEKSDLRMALQSDEVLKIFADIRDHMVPFEDRDLLRIPFAGEMYGHNLSSRIKPDGHDQWPLMEEKRNRLASRYGSYEWGWLQNKDKTSSTNFCSVDYIGFAGNWSASGVLGVRPVFLIAEEKHENMG